MATNKSASEEIIRVLDLSFIKSRLIKRGELHETEWSSTEQEFKRFMLLILHGTRALAVMSPKVDKVWHEFVLFTEKYSAFCDAAFGSYIHHRPRTSITPVGADAITRFYESYSMRFGEVPDTWFELLSQEQRTAVMAGQVISLDGLDWSGWPGCKDS